MAAKSERRGLRAPVADSRRTIRPPETEPRERDERFHSLLRLSTGFYWETDARHRLTKVIRGPRSVTPWRPKGQIGKTRWELPSTGPDQAGWQAHRKTLARHLPFRDFEYSRPMPDGSERHYRISGEPIFAADKTFRGYRGVGHDITELKLAESASRESEARFRSLTELSSDWYWEQDEQYRMTLMSAGLAEGTGIDVKLYLGQKRWDLPAINLTEADWARHRAQLERHEPFFDFEIQRPAPDGRTMWLSVSGAPVIDAEGRFRGYRGIGRHITERKRSEQLLHLEHSVVRCLADAANGAEALKAVMRAVCESEGWQCGRYFKVDETANVLRFAQAWSAPDAAIEEFVARSSRLVFQPGVGLAGRAWQTAQALWSTDTGSDPRVRETNLAQDFGIRGAFVFPIISEGKTIGVMAFSSNTIRNPDERLLQAVRAIGGQIGQFSRRIQVQELLRESEERFRSLTEISADAYWEQDAEFRFTRFQGMRAWGENNPALASYLGKPRWEIGLEIDGGWESHRALLQAHKPFRDVVTYRALGDGRIRYVSVSGDPVFDSEGRFAGYRGVGREITERVRGEKLVILEHAVARCLADAENVPNALKAVIRAVCETENWAFGRYFRVDEKAAVLRFGEFWCVDGDAAQDFLEKSRGIVQGPGEGLTGKVWQSGQPLWIADIDKDSRATRLVFTPESGIRGVFVFPVMSEGKTIGVLAFNSREIREPDERLLQAASVIGSQIGQFLQRKQAEDALRESEERFRSLTQMSSDFFWESDGEHRMTRVVHGPTYIPIQFPDSPTGKTPWEIPSAKPDAAGWASLKATMDAHLPFRDFEYARPARDGTIRHLSVSGEPYLAADGTFLGYRGVGQDITELVDARERIASLAFNDALTGLANRTSLGAALDHALQIAHRHERNLAIVFIDLDGFKQINDAHGHDIGDRLLIEFANRLRACLRTSDFVSRIGGDEFVVLLEEIRDKSHVEAVAHKLLAEIEQPHALVAGENLRITASIGISMYPEDGGDARALMKNADTAMYRAKEKGKNSVCFYGPEPEQDDWVV